MSLKKSDLDIRLSDDEKQDIINFVTSHTNNISADVATIANKIGNKAGAFIEEGLYQEMLKGIAAKMGGVGKAIKALGGIMPPEENL